MQCQSCGSDIKRSMKQCPACGEEATAFTASLPSKPKETGELESQFMRKNNLARAGSAVDNPPVNPVSPISEERYPGNSSLNNLNNLSSATVNGRPNGSGSGNSSIHSPINGSGNGSINGLVNGSNKAIGNGFSGGSINGSLNGQSASRASTAVKPAMYVSEPILPPPAVEVEELPISEALPAPGVQTREAMPPTDIIRPGLTCRRCHQSLKSGAKFCSVCGVATEPSAFAKALDSAQQIARDSFQALQAGFRQTSLPTMTIILLGLAGLFALMAVVQYLIPAGIDAENRSPLIYHLRSIEFLLAALVSVVASLVVSRR